VTTSTDHITQSLSPTPGELILGTAYVAAYDAGHAEGTIDAHYSPTAAITRVEYALDHLAHPWAQGYWDAVMERALGTAAAAWDDLEKENHR
jgi:hypothetical protein